MANARSARRLLSRGARWVLRRRQAVGVAGRVARLVESVPDPRIAVLGPADAAVLARLRRRLPGARVVEVPAAPAKRHLVMTASGPFDVIVDRPHPDGRVRRFGSTFYHLRAGGLYVVPGGAGELGPHPGPLGRLLEASFAMRPVPPLRRRLAKLPKTKFRAIRDHVTARDVAGDLVLSHDIPDVHVKVREEHLNDLLQEADTPHRVLAVIEAAAPAPPDVHEVPEPRAKHRGWRLRAVPLNLRDYRDVVVGPHQMALADGIVLPDSYRHHPAPILSSKALIDLVPRFAVPLVPLPADPPRLDGTFVHLDNEARGHFGHLLTESLARVWTWPEALALDPDARVLVGATRARPALLEYELQVYEACGIPRDRVVLVDGPVHVDRLISGTPMFSNPHYVHPRMADTWQAVGDRLAARASDRTWPRRIFVSRRLPKRACLNAAEVEGIFVDHGFEIVFPEDHPLGDQVQMFRQAEVIAGYSGSGMFHIAFVADPKRVIQIGSSAYNARNEFLMAAVRRHRIDSIVCRAERKHIKSDFRYDEAREGPHLRRILAELEHV